MRDKNVVEAKRIGGEGRIAAHAALHVAAMVELHLPERPARRVGDEEIAVVVERETVCNQRLRAEGVRRIAGQAASL
jgi:hypothetical protein